MGMREKLMKLIASKHELLINLNTNIPKLFKLAEHLVENDVVQVVRCKDCKWWRDFHCTNKKGAGGLIVNGDWFCCAGERKDNKDV